MMLAAWKKSLCAAAATVRDGELTTRARIDGLTAELATLRADHDTLTAMAGRFYQAGRDDALREMASDGDGPDLRLVRPLTWD